MRGRKKGSKLSEQKLQELEQLQKDTLVLDSSVTYKRSNIAPNLMIGDDGSYYFIRPRQRNLLGIRWPTKMHNSDGYPTQAAVCIGCSVDENGKKRTKVVNMGRLVLDAFNVIPANNGQDEVDHINRNPYDNRLTNLRWATRQQNVINRDLTNVHEACRRRDKRAKENGFADWGEYMRSFRGKNETR